MRWHEIRSCRITAASCRTPARGAGPCRRPSTRRCRPRCSPPRSTRVSARASNIPSPSRCCPPCATGSAGMSNRTTSNLRMAASPEYRWHEFDTRTAFEQAASRFILQNAELSITARGAFRIVLAGGNTPRNIYSALRSAATDWSAWHVYFGDERCLFPDDPDRNSAMVRSLWLDHVAIPARQIHLIPGELGAETAAAIYAREVAAVDEFDLVLLGLGEDGHTASLFPGKDWGEAEDALPVLAVHDAPKLPSDRVTLSVRRLSRARKVVFLVAGESKVDALTRLVAGDRIPASAIRPESGVDIYTDLATVFHP